MLDGGTRGLGDWGTGRMMCSSNLGNWYENKIKVRQER